MGQEDCMEEEMVTHFSIFAWRIPWIEEPGGLQSMGSQSLTVTLTDCIKCYHWEKFDEGHGSFVLFSQILFKS